MAISPMRVGDTAPAIAWTLVDNTGAALPLTGATFQLVLRNVETGVDLTGAGTFAITNAGAGKVSYSWAAADTATAGTYQIVVYVTLPGTGRLSTDPLSWVLQAV